MDEKKLLKVIDRIEEELQLPENEFNQRLQSFGQTNPIYRNLAKFTNSKIGEKFSLKDLLR